MLILFVAAVLLGTTQCQPFTASVSTLDHYMLGEEVTCEITITNNLKEDCHLFKRNTPFEDFKSPLFKITQNGARIQYDALIFKRGPVDKFSNYVTIHGKESISIKLDLSSAYAINKPALYTVQLKTRIYYIHAGGDIASMNIFSQLDQFEVLNGSGSPGPTIAGKLRLQEPHPKTFLKLNRGKGEVGTVAKDPVFAGDGDDVDKATAKTVWEAAHGVATQAPSAVDKNDSHYVTWFGKVDPGHALTVKGVYLDMVRAMEMEVYTLFFKGPDCERSDYAYTYFESSTIYLCDGYLRAEDTFDYNSKLGIIIHQLTIATANTENTEKGPENCMNLAVDQPQEAVNNAGNYEYFCETLQ